MLPSAGLPVFHAIQLLQNGRCGLPVAALCSGDVLLNAIAHGLMRFLAHINVGKVVFLQQVFMVFDDHAVHNRRAAIGFRNRRPVDISDAHIIVVVDCVEIVLVYHYGMVFIMMLAVVIIVMTAVMMIIIRNRSTTIAEGPQ